MPPQISPNSVCVSPVFLRRLFIFSAVSFDFAIGYPRITYRDERKKVVSLILYTRSRPPYLHGSYIAKGRFSVPFHKYTISPRSMRSFTFSLAGSFTSPENPGYFAAVCALISCSFLISISFPVVGS